MLSIYVRSLPETHDDKVLSCKANTYLREYQPFPGKRAFQAKVTKCFPVGYTIETVIDGKLLRGVLFSNKLSFSGHTDDNSKRRKGCVEIDHVKLNDDQKSYSASARPIKQDNVNDRLADSVHGKNMEAAAPPASAASPNMKSSVPSDASRPHEVSGNLEVPMVADVNVEDNETKGALKASTEVHKEIISSAAKDSVTTSPNLEGRALTGEEHSSLIKNVPAQSV
ncbi:hypothetical protein U1Q18_005193 [Sarracenia purpurea var. burkii]